MDSTQIGRRTFIRGAGIAALTALHARAADAQVAVPNSVGTELPKLKAPPGACDCHHHIYDAMRFPPKDPGPQFQPNGRVEEYRLLQRRIGTTRNVIVTPAAYVDNNSITLDAIARLGANARGVAPLAKRVLAFGWHIQLFLPADRIAAAADLWNRLPNTLVFDHLGHLPEPQGTSHPAYGVIRRLIDKGKTWVKISGAYIDTKAGPPAYADSTKVAQAYVQAAPERMVWGSDWPHPSLPFDNKPNDAVLFDLLLQWAPNERERNRILVDNPQTLYGFPKI
jgi:predicted TIM-barrel fold metal-dependent hydrolase